MAGRQRRTLMLGRLSLALGLCFLGLYVYLLAFVIPGGTIVDVGTVIWGGVAGMAAGVAGFVAGVVALRRARDTPWPRRGLGWALALGALAIIAYTIGLQLVPYGALPGWVPFLALYVVPAVTGVVAAGVARCRAGDPWPGRGACWSIWSDSRLVCCCADLKIRSRLAAP